MPRGPRIAFDNACYHIATRGNQKQRVFLVNEDYVEYLARLKRYKYRYNFRLYGYCLMPNHVHLIGFAQKKQDVSKFMHNLNRSYTAYFNEKYNKVGHLWQGRFKSKIIMKDRYMIDCINYVEQNPIRANLAASPIDYMWNSYAERTLAINQSGGLLDLYKDSLGEKGHFPEQK
jgi:putative transposase